MSLQFDTHLREGVRLPSADFGSAQAFQYGLWQGEVGSMTGTGIEALAYLAAHHMGTPMDKATFDKSYGQFLEWKEGTTDVEADVRMKYWADKAQLQHDIGRHTTAGGVATFIGGFASPDLAFFRYTPMIGAKWAPGFTKSVGETLSPFKFYKDVGTRTVLAENAAKTATERASVSQFLERSANNTFHGVVVNTALEPFLYAADDWNGHKRTWVDTANNLVIGSLFGLVGPAGEQGYKSLNPNTRNIIGSWLLESRLRGEKPNIANLPADVAKVVVDNHNKIVGELKQRAVAKKNPPIPGTNAAQIQQLTARAAHVNAEIEVLLKDTSLTTEQRNEKMLELSAEQAAINQEVKSLADPLRGALPPERQPGEEPMIHELETRERTLVAESEELDKRVAAGQMSERMAMDRRKAIRDERKQISDEILARVNKIAADGKKAPETKAPPQPSAETKATAPVGETAQTQLELNLPNDPTIAPPRKRAVRKKAEVKTETKVEAPKPVEKTQTPAEALAEHGAAKKAASQKADALMEAWGKAGMPIDQAWADKFGMTAAEFMDFRRNVGGIGSHNWNSARYSTAERFTPKRSKLGDIGAMQERLKILENNYKGVTDAQMLKGINNEKADIRKKLAEAGHGEAGPHDNAVAMAHPVESLLGRFVEYKGKTGILARDNSGRLEVVLDTDNKLMQPETLLVTDGEVTLSKKDPGVEKRAEAGPLSEQDLEDIRSSRQAAADIAAGKGTAPHPLVPGTWTTAKIMRSLAKSFRKLRLSPNNEDKIRLARVLEVKRQEAILRDNLQALVDADMLFTRDGQKLGDRDLWKAWESGEIRPLSDEQREFLRRRELNLRNLKKAEFIKDAEDPQTVDEHLVDQIFDEVFGTKVKFVSEEAAFSHGFVGMWSPATPGHVYVRRGALGGQYGMLMVGGHEIFHGVRMRDPEMALSMVDVMLDPKLAVYFQESWHETVKEKVRSGELSAYDSPLARMDEVLASVFGHVLLSKHFWKNLRTVNEAHADKLSGLILKLGKAVTRRVANASEGGPVKTMEGQLAKIISTMNEEGTGYALKDKKRLADAWEYSLNEQEIPYGSDSKRIIFEGYTNRKDKFRHLQDQTVRAFEQRILADQYFSYEEMAEDLFPSDFKFHDKSGVDAKHNYTFVRRGVDAPQGFLLNMFLGDQKASGPYLEMMEKHGMVTRDWLKDHMPMASWKLIGEKYKIGYLEVGDYEFTMHKDDRFPSWTELRDTEDRSGTRGRPGIDQTKLQFKEYYGDIAAAFAKMYDEIIGRTLGIKREDFETARDYRMALDNAMFAAEHTAPGLRAAENNGPGVLPGKKGGASYDSQAPRRHPWDDQHEGIQNQVYTGILDVLYEMEPEAIQKAITPENWPKFIEQVKDHLEKKYYAGMEERFPQDFSGLNDFATTDEGGSLQLGGIEDNGPKLLVKGRSQHFDALKKAAAELGRKWKEFREKHPEIEQHNDPDKPDVHIREGDVVDFGLEQEYKKKFAELRKSQYDVMMNDPFKGKFNRLRFESASPEVRESFSRDLDNAVYKLIYDLYPHLEPAMRADLKRMRAGGADWRVDPTFAKETPPIMIHLGPGEEPAGRINTQGESEETNQTPNRYSEENADDATPMEMTLEEALASADRQAKQDRSTSNSSLNINRRKLQAEHDLYGGWISDLGTYTKEQVKGALEHYGVKDAFPDPGAPKPAKTETPPKYTQEQQNLIDQLATIRQSRDTALIAIRKLVRSGSLGDMAGPDAFGARDVLNRQLRLKGSTGEAEAQAIKDITLDYTLQARNVLLNHNGQKKIGSLFERGMKYTRTFMDAMGRRGVKIDRVSVDATRAAQAYTDTMALHQVILRTGLSSQWNKGALNGADWRQSHVSAVLDHMHPQGKKSTSQSITEVADVLQLTVDAVGGRVNSLGGAFRRLEGRAFARIHTPLLMSENRTRWYELLNEIMDWERTTGEANMDPGAKKAFLDAVFKQIIDTQHDAPNGDSSALSRSQLHRELFFLPDMGADYRYDMEFGSLSTGDEIFQQIIQRSAQATYMFEFGPDFLANWNKKMAEMGLAHRKGFIRGFFDDMVQADRTFKTMIGEYDHPVDISLDRRAKSAMHIANAAQLPLSVFGSTQDLAHLSSVMQYFGKDVGLINKEVMEAIARSLTDPQYREAMMAMGSFLNSMNMSSARHNATGFYKGTSVMNDIVMDRTFLKLQSRVMQDVAYDMLSKQLGVIAQMKGAYDQNTIHALNFFGLSEAEFREIAKHAKEIDGLEGVRVAPDLITNDRKLSLKLRGFMINAVSHIQLQPSIGTKAFLRGGTYAGTPLGVLMQLFSQFKEMPLALATKQMGRLNYGYGDLNAPKWGFLPKRAGLGHRVSWYGQMLATTFVALAIKDLLRGKEPLNPLDPDHWNWHNIARVATNTGFGPIGALDAVANNFTGPVIGMGLNLSEAALKMGDKGSVYRTNEAIMGVAPVGLLGIMGAPAKEAERAIAAAMFGDAYVETLRAAYEYGEYQSGQVRFIKP